ncbi:MAG TPA: methyltransferase domain-containing protein [Thermoplasmata archaeon]|nr:methyltransferase domain-containing protein [Thermoplasmata archaeon]
MAESSFIHEGGWSREQGLARLETPARLRSRENERLWEMVGLVRGESVADVGAGTGYFAFEAARRVGPRATVWAIDISPDLVALLEERRRAWRRPRLTPVRSTPERIPLPGAIADVVLLANFLHGAPGGTVREATRLLKPRGRFVVVDWEKRESNHGPPLARRLSLSEAETRLRGVGLVPVAEGRLGAEHYVIVATPRPDG